MRHLPAGHEHNGRLGATSPRSSPRPPPAAITTLADVRDLVEKRLPAPYRHKATWRHLSTRLAEAAQGEKDLLEICVSLRLCWRRKASNA
jgi:hypothetical protein